MSLSKESLIGLIKFILPKFYNRITMVIVIAGLSLVSKSLLLEIVNKILQTQFNWTLVNEYDPLIGLILVIIALIYNGYVHKNIAKPTIELENNEWISSHNLEDWNSRLDTILAILNCVKNDHSILSQELRCLDDYYEFISCQKAKLIGDDVKNAIHKHDKSFSLLLKFLHRNFFIHPDYKTIEDLRFSYNANRLQLPVKADSDLLIKYSDEAIYDSNQIKNLILNGKT